MLNLRGSLQDMVEASANVVLAGEGTPAGREALLRMTLLLTLLERLEAGGGSWHDCDLLPDSVPLLSGLEWEALTPLPH